jgi:hypothetical protein
MSTRKRLTLSLGHERGVVVNAQLTDLEHASLAVGVENEAHDPADPAIELLAVIGVVKLLAVRTRGILVLGAAGSDLAPACLRVLAATWTTTLEVGIARAAIEAAAGDQIPIHLDFSHRMYS